jgi:excisionase family DNA binding protein
VTTSRTPLPPLFTVGEIAKLLKVSTKSVRRWIEAGDLIAHRLGRQLRITESDLSTFIKQCRDA